MPASLASESTLVRQAAEAFAYLVSRRGLSNLKPWLLRQGVGPRTRAFGASRPAVYPRIVERLCHSETLREPGLSGSATPCGLQVRVITGRCLSAEHVAAWRALQQSNPELANPCFCPEFVQAVAAVRNDVEVAVIEQDRRIAAFFPYQRRRAGRAVPVGGIVSDYQGLIARPGFTCDPRDLIKGCGLAAWDFDRLLASQACFAPYHKLCEPSACIDLSGGYQAYLAERRAAGTRQIQDCEYVARRLEREIGPLRFVVHSPDPRHLTEVLAWKSQQYRRTGWRDLFAAGWGRGLVEQIQAIQHPGFAGMLSLLYAGDRLIAGHLGMRSRTIWHYWFPAYDRQFARYSPGLVLLLKMAACAEELGLRSIDIGTGITLYKQRLMNAAVSVAEGSVEAPSCLHLLRSVRRRIKSILKAAPRR